jgi:hypothetical protein
LYVFSLVLFCLLMIVQCLDFKSNNLFTPKIHILHIWRSLLLNMNLNFWNSSISLNEGTTELK